VNENNVVYVDLRDYQDSAKNPVQGAINIPCGYLKRYRKEIPDTPIVIIASSEVEKNFGARMLKKYGFNVKGYTIPGPSQ
jgi:rhodanese-related sulfurtransferase